jgi:hypothetical protein
MTVRPRIRSILAACAALPLVVASPVFAYEADDVADRLAGALANWGYKVSWASASMNGDAIVMEGVRADFGHMDRQVEIGAVVLDGVAETDDGAFTVETVSLPDYSFERNGVKLSVIGTSFSNLVLPPEGAEKTLQSIIWPHIGMSLADLSLASINIAGPDGEFFTMANFDVTTNVSNDGGQIEHSMSIENFTLNFAALPEPETGAAFATLAALGYSVVEGSYDSYATWNPDDGRTVSRMAIDVKDAGTLDFNFDIAGYTMEFNESLQTMMIEEGENEDAEAAMLALMRQLTVHSAKLRFDDNSLTNRVLEFIAAQQGMKPSDIVNQVKAILPFALAQLNDPKFAAEITAAVSTYLDDPRSIKISVEPGAPLPIATLIAGARSAPEQLPNQLGVKVTANR